MPRRIGKIGSEIIVATPYTGFTLLNSKLQEGSEKSKHSAMLPYNPVFTVAENYVYFAKTNKPPKNNDPMYDFTKAAGSDVYRVPVSGAAFGKEELVKSVHGVITGLAYNPKTKLVGVVSVEKAAKNDKDGQKSYGYFTAIKADKTVVVEKRLPLNKEVLTKFPHTMKETVFGKTSYVGNAVLLAAADGSWIYYAAQNVKDTDPKSKYTVVGRADAYSNHNHNNLLYRITSDGTATYLEGSDTPRSYADQAMPFFAFDGVNLVRYNTEKAGLSRMQVLKYSDGKLTTLIPESRFGNAIGTATAAIDPASWGIGVITLDTRRGKLVQIAPSGRVVAEQDIPGGTFSATSIQHQGSAIFDSASGILYVPMLGTDGKFKIGKFQRSANYVEPVAEQVLGTELDPYVDRGNPNAQPPNSEQPAAEVPAPADGKPQTLPNSNTVQNHNNAADSTNKQNVTAKVKQDLPANNVAAGADAKIAQLSKTGSSAAIAGGIALSFLAMGGICVAWISARNRAALKSE
ncbi:hypothetical protein [Arcanobacterium hippocoleae]|uniref:hypothetical protein n=1 Tax=Arcanobacterium hippocoleae TaxID=149017 RepID=UPI00333FAE01